MLDYLAIFTKGGALLWAWQLSALQGDPVGALVRSCLLEDRGGERSFSYTPPASSGGGYLVKWSFHNALQLVVVAVHARALSLLYVDQLLEDVKQVFAVKHYQPHLYEYPKFDGTFRRLLADAEAAAEAARRPTAQPKTTPTTTNGQRTGQRGGGGGGEQSSSGDEKDGGAETDGDVLEGGSSKAPAGTAAARLARMALQDEGPSSGVSSGAEAAEAGSGAEDGASAGNRNGAFDTSALGKRLGRRRPGLGRGPAKAPEPEPHKSPQRDAKPKKKEARHWDGARGKAKDLDFSAAIDGTQEAGGTALKPLDLGRSLVDADAEDLGDDSEDASYTS